MSVLVDLSGVTSVARSSSLGVDDNLGIDGDGRSSLELVQDVKSISDSRSTSLGPAGATVAGNVLVLVP